jgi:hypothetical protein
METGLALPIPEAEPVVSHLRAIHDPSAADGMPAHVTVLFPFRPYEEIDDACLTGIEEIMADAEPLDIVFRGHSRFPTVLWLAPEPADPIVRLTEAAVSRFPEHLPYGDAFDTITPHLTVAEGDEDVLERAGAEMTKALREPLKAKVQRCVLFACESGRWREKQSFHFGGRKS